MLLVISILFAAQSHAAGYVVGKIDTMQQAFGGWLIRLEGTDNPDGCSQPQILLTPSVSQYDEVYSMLLTAYVADKTLNIYVNGCHSAGYKQFAFVSADW